MTDVLLKEPGPFERPAPPLCPHPVRLAHCHGVLAATPPPSQALCHCKSPHRLKQTHSGGGGGGGTAILHSYSYSSMAWKKKIVPLSQNIQETQMGVTCGQRGTAERREKVGVTVSVGVQQQLKEGRSVRKWNTEGAGG